MEKTYLHTIPRNCPVPDIIFLQRKIPFYFSPTLHTDLIYSFIEANIDKVGKVGISFLGILTIRQK